MDKPDLSLFPETPGVYLYKDADGRILYVGKARRLRRRIASYFRDPAGLSPKTRLLVRNAEHIDILNTGTEKEALLLEASLIKKHRPRYNITLRDDKEYLLFRISSEHPFPRIEIVRRNQRRKGRAQVFGPFSSALAARETWKLLHQYFPLRRCRDRAFANRTRPCLYFHMGRCLGPCTQPVPPEAYRAMLDKVVLLLSGRSRELARTLAEEMNRAAVELRYEAAAVLRDQIRAVERTLERQSVVLSGGTNLDLVGVAQAPEGLALGLVIVRDGLLLDGRNYFWPGLGVEDTPELLTGFLSQYYLSLRGFGEVVPPRIVVPWLPVSEAGNALEPSETANGGRERQSEAGDRNGNSAPEQAGDVQGASEGGDLFKALESVLSEIRGGPVAIRAPRGQDEDKLVLMAVANAREAIKSREQRPLAEMLAACLGAPAPVRRIEVVDISHTGGAQTRAGLVVYEDEEPVDYRSYDMDADLAAAGYEAGDDPAALYLWAGRRIHSGPPFPDLVLVDGGRSQLAAVARAFAEAGLPVPLAGIAKARQEDGRADRRAGNVSDRIFLPARSNPLALQPGSPELLFLQRLRDSAHDFALGRHRRARSAATLAGELTRLPGVGPKTARLLFDHFGSLTALAEAGEEGIARVPGIGRAKARSLAERLSALVARE